jgi:hypothetical protein
MLVLIPVWLYAPIRRWLRPTISLDGAAAFGAFWKNSMVVPTVGEG